MMILPERPRPDTAILITDAIAQAARSMASAMERTDDPSATLPQQKKAAAALARLVSALGLHRPLPTRRCHKHVQLMALGAHGSYCAECGNYIHRVRPLLRDYDDGTWPVCIECAVWDGPSEVNP